MMTARFRVGARLTSIRGMGPDLRFQVLVVPNVPWPEISLYYPTFDAQVPAFEHMATDVLPLLRREHA